MSFPTIGCVPNSLSVIFSRVWLCTAIMNDSLLLDYDYVTTIFLKAGHVYEPLCVYIYCRPSLLSGVSKCQ
jgi:hypothetical protein